MRILGHTSVRNRLATLAHQGTIGQSYVFFGPQGVGKSLCALEFAAILCGEENFEPTAEKPHPFDVMILRPETEVKRGVTKERSLSAEQSRDGIQFLSRFPVSGRYRVLIIEDAHRLSLSAQNVLLKTLEEPNPSAVILFVTHEIGSLLPTILSRVERVRFGFVPEALLREEGASFFPTVEQALPPFFFSLGRPGILIQASENTESFALTQQRLGTLFRLSTLSLKERLRLAEELALNVPETIRLLEWWLPGLHAQGVKLVERAKMQRFFGFLSDVEESRAILRTTQSNARLVLEKLFLSL